MALPTTEIVDTPAGEKMCLLRVDKNLKGEQSVSIGGEYACQMGTVNGKLQLKLIITTGGACDEDPNLIPNNSVLAAKGFYILRNDRLAHFWGAFTIQTPAGSTIIKGRIETFYRVGSHTTNTTNNCEPCDPDRHVEGWLVGAHRDGKRSLRAMIAARASAPTPTNTPSFTGKLAGVVVRPL
jgi:hypothetical protein